MRHIADLVNPQPRNDILSIVGGSMGQELRRATDDQPFEILGTEGVRLTFGNGTTVVHIPIDRTDMSQAIVW